jgi:preprotein translocase subunit SecG
MIDILLNVFYVLIAIAMIVLILLQRGAGAQAGSGFGAGASGTVFGARGSANFLSSTTKWLAAVFFALSLFMAYQATHRATGTPDQTDLGVMSNLPATPAKPDAGALAPAPLAPPPASTAPAAAPAPVDAPVITPSAPAATPPAPQESAPAPTEGRKDG